MRAIVPGAGGFVGHHLIDHLMAAGDEVITSNLRLVSDGIPVQRRDDTPEG